MIGIVTDSTADLPPDLCRELNIRVVPTYLNVGERSLRDGEDLSRSEFYASLPTLRPIPTTAAPSAGEFEATYRALVAAGARAIVSIHAAANLSGIFNAARLGAEASGAEVKVVDSGQVSMALGYPVLAAARAAMAGLPISAVLDAVRETARRVRLFALLDTLEYLRHSGRVSWLRAGIGDLLHVKALVELAEGHVRSLGQIRTRRAAIASLLERARGLGPLEHLAVLHAAARPDAEAIAAQLAARSRTDPLIVEATPILGTHVGPRALGVAAVLR